MKLKHIVAAGLAAAGTGMAAAFGSYLFGFHSPARKPLGPDEFSLPQGDIYLPYEEKMRQWTREARALPRERVEIQSFDGLTLRGYYYAYSPDAPVEIMFHGYRGSAERDMPGGVQRAFALGHSCLVVDQRAGGTSDGHVISFGVNERRDCLAWIDFAIQKLGPDVKLILTGISMGAATVVMAAGEELPPNVIGVLADCGYSCQEKMIRLTIRRMGLPVPIAYPIAKLGARIFGNFDLEETTPLKALETCKVPIIFFHGDDDAFVPCEMSREMYEACPTRKRLVIIPGAGHGLSYAVDPQTYLREAREFFHG